jgi:hypothetical protein
MGADERAAQAEPGDPAALAGRLFRDMTGALEILTVYLGERPDTMKARTQAQSTAEFCRHCQSKWL